jgi:hypothetical protein
MKQTNTHTHSRIIIKYAYEEFIFLFISKYDSIDKHDHIYFIKKKIEF